MSGSNVVNSNAVYGTQGIPSVNNHPNALYSGYCWTDLQGEFWAYGCDEFADMWHFNPNTLEWTWVKGNGLSNVAPVYGTQGVSNVNNTPGTRGYNGCAWTDNAGDLWLYGGEAGTFSDLWRYKISNNEWTWMSGSSSTGQPPVYGTLGVPAPGNFPGMRRDIGSSWVDNNGNLWLYGGIYGGGGSKGDLWMYNVTTNLWAWMAGSNTNNPPAVYGPVGVYGPNYTPGERWPYAMWVGADGHFWLFGGGSGGNNAHGDMWQYDPVINQWAFMGGNQLLDEDGSSSGLCSFSSTNVPDSRFENRAAWVDNCGNFWMYGGTQNYSTYYDDMWVYKIADNQWAKVYSGTALNYGTLGVPAISNDPGQKAGTLHWKDNQGSFWVFGGMNSGFSNSYADMWRFIPDSSCISVLCITNPPIASFTHEDTGCVSTCVNYTNTSSANCTSWNWTFEGGTPPFFSGQYPPAVCYDTVGVFDIQLIVSNPNGSDTALSQIEIINCPLYAEFHSDSDEYCMTDCVTFINTSSMGANAFQWSFQGGNPTSSNLENPLPVCYNTAGVFSVQLIASNNSASDTVVHFIKIIDCSPTAAFTGIDTLCNTVCQSFLNNSSANCTSWNWAFPGGFPSSYSGNNPPAICYQPGDYTATLIVGNAYGGDTATFSFYILDCNPPTAGFIQSDTVICNSECITYSNTSSVANTYQWIFGGGVPASFIGANPPVVCYPNSGNYVTTLTATNNYGSDVEIQNIVVQYCGPSANFSMSESSICIDKCISFTDASTGNPSTWQWIFQGGTPSSSTLQIPPTVCYHSTGTFSVTLICTNQYGADTLQKLVAVHPLPIVEIVPLVSNIHLGESVQLNATGGSFYLWAPSESLSNPIISNPVASPFNTTIYIVTVNSEFGCIGYDTALVNVIKYVQIPTAFSPNSDGKNDYFHLMNPEDVKSIDIKIYTRWGELIFESQDAYFSWNGKYKDELQEIDVYVWTLIYTPNHSEEIIQRKGNVTLLR